MSPSEWSYLVMAGIIEKIKNYKAEIALAALYIYVIILGIATFKELGII